MAEKEKTGGERWKMALVNLSEMGTTLESLQTILAKKAVFVDNDTFSKATIISEQTRNIKALEQRVETLERELDAAISAAARARSEKRKAESAQRVAELRALDVTRELENTTTIERCDAKFREALQCYNTQFRESMGVISWVLDKVDQISQLDESELSQMPPPPQPPPPHSSSPTSPPPSSSTLEMQEAQSPSAQMLLPPTQIIDMVISSTPIQQPSSRMFEQQQTVTHGSVKKCARFSLF